jgi:hypothetical protein
LSDPVQIAKRAREALARARETLDSATSAPPEAVDVAVKIAQAIAALGPIERTSGAEVDKHATAALARAGEAHAALSALGGEGLSAAREALATACDVIRELAMTPAVATPAIAPRAEAGAARAAASHVTSIAIGPTGTVKQPPNAAAFAPAPGPTGTVAQPPVPAAFAAPAGGTAPMGDPTGVAVTLGADTPSHLWVGQEGGDVLARGGLFVADDAGRSVGTPVRVALTLPGGAFEVLGVVRWSRARSPLAAAGYGVTLVELSGDARQAIAAYAASRAPMLYGK